MAHEQRKLAHESKRQGTSMNTLSLFATVFLPVTYIAVRRKRISFCKQANQGSGQCFPPHSLTLKMLQAKAM